MPKWEGQLTLADFLHINKPDNKIRLKCYVPSYELQGDTEEIDYEDVKDWGAVKDKIIQKMLDDFHWTGVYTDNKLNRRLDRIGKPKKDMIPLIDVTNDKYLTETINTVNKEDTERRDTILLEAFDRSESVDELPGNTSKIVAEVSVLAEEITKDWRKPSFEIPIFEEIGVTRPMRFDELKGLGEKVKLIAELRKTHPELVPQRPSMAAIPEDILEIAEYTQRKVLVFKSYLRSFGYTDEEINLLRKTWRII
jgi:hypothetical protein